jgi:putative hydrolase of the HAD superfamily
MQGLDYVFFDLDGTLYDYESTHLLAQKELTLFIAAQIGQSVELVESGLSVSRTAVKRRLGETASSHSKLLYISEYLRNFNFASRPSLALSAEQVYWRTFLKNMALFPDVKDFLTVLRLEGCNTVLVTDLNSSIQFRKITWLGLEGYFDVVLTSEEAGGDKVTGKLEDFLRELLPKTEWRGWCIGDQEWDHLLKGSTIFFEKVSGKSGRSPSLSGGKFHEFRQLISLLTSTS